MKKLVKNIHQMLKGKYTDNPLEQKKSAQNPIVEKLIKQSKI